jgi:ribonuclease HI
MSGVDGVVALFGDGGCIGVNPSPIGAPWAVCGVDAAGRRVWERTGVLTPAMVGTAGATNNQSEFVAILMGLEAMPDGWSGRSTATRW